LAEFISNKEPRDSESTRRRGLRVRSSLQAHRDVGVGNYNWMVALSLPLDVCSLAEHVFVISST
jgi:hypothetical protein